LTLKKIWMNWSTFLHLFVQLLKYSMKYW
jgi:hypothetical protein